MKCFVIIGYGKNTSYANGKVRTLNLDETYEDLIKPVFDELMIACERAIDINHSGSIDKIMLEEIATADVVVADISTLNPNVMWELGVRHALRPYHTIILAEKEQMSSLPFDLQHFVVHEYLHSDVGIPNREVPRFKKHLKELVNKIIAQGAKHTDSPVYTFLGNRLDIRIQTGEPEDVVRSGAEVGESLASLLEKAEAAQKKKEYANAIVLLKRAKYLSEKSSALMAYQSLIIERLALCTYKLGLPDLHSALLEAERILSVLNPQSSQDKEVLGLSGAIQKRLFGITGELAQLESAIYFYQRGFSLQQDYYNGINLVFSLIQKADLQKTANDSIWQHTRSGAYFFCEQVSAIARQQEKAETFAQSTQDDAIWVLLTLAEVFHYQQNEAEMAAYEQKAEQLAADRGDLFAMNSYSEQKSRVSELLARLNTK